MTSVLKSIFSPPKPTGPDPALLEAQQRQEARIIEKEKKEKDKLAARKRVLRAQQGGNIAALFAETGETGVAEKLGA
jgi:hypothetical protein